MCGKAKNWLRADTDKRHLLLSFPGSLRPRWSFTSTQTGVAWSAFDVVRMFETMQFLRGIEERFQHAVDDFDLRWVGAIVKRDGVVEETGLGAGVLDDPVTGILWLVHRLAAYGQGVEAGQVVLAGSFIRPIEAPPGSRFQADYGPFGQVDISFG